MAKFKEYLVRGVYAVLFVRVFLLMSFLLGGFVTEGKNLMKCVWRIV